MLGSAGGEALVEARKPVVGNRFPYRRVGDHLTAQRPDAGIAVDDAETHERDLVAARRRAEQGRAAFAAEDLPKAAFGLPALQELFTCDDPKRARLEAGGRRGRATRPALAAGAVAVASGSERLVDLELHGSAAAMPSKD